MTTRFNRRMLLGGTALIAFSLSTRAAAGDRVSIATSMPILEDIVANVAGDHADVFSILPASADPHTWEAKPEDMVRLSEADGFLFFGADLEPFVETGGWRQTVQDNSIPEFEVSAHVDLIPIGDVNDQSADEHDPHAADPHIWLDPLIIVQAVPAIAAFLGEVDADNASDYEANADAYVAALEDLHQSLEKSFSAIPDNRRKLVVFHDAWSYFAARYDFEIIGIVMENPDAEVSAQEMVDLMKIMEDSGTNVVFAEPQFNTSVLDVLSEEGDIEIATLLTDSFAEGVETYIELMQFNRDQIVTYLDD